MLPPWAFSAALRRLRADAPPEVDALRERSGEHWLARHRHASLPVGAFLDDQHLGLDVALDAACGTDLEAATAVDVTLVVAADDDVVGLDGARARVPAG